MRDDAPYAERRKALLARSGCPGPGRRRELAVATDAWLGELLTAAAEDTRGLALVAVGGHGRGELSPGSDLDLLLLHDARRDAATVASRLWYPIWDAGVRLDHSVRTPEEARSLAASDVTVLLGLLDVRHVAGDPGLAAALRSAVLGDWRSLAPRRLLELRDSCQARWARTDDVAYALEPDLKEGRGGLRDVVALRAVAASWLADRPHGDLDAARAALLDVRDALHLATGRAGDRLLLQEQDAVAARLGLADADSVLRKVSTAARAVGYAGDVTWRRVEQVVRPSRRRWRGGRVHRARLLAPGLAEHGGEVVLTADARPEADPVIALRAAAVAAQAGLPLGPATLDRLAAACPPMPDPWPGPALEALLALLGSGPALVPVWEALDQAGIVSGLLPEWEPVRARPQRNAVHRWTVDRHLVETAVAASAAARRVARPDLLVLAALLHDIGKGRRRGDHSRAGAGIARPLCERLGLPRADVDTVVTLVREHLLLVDAATRRDLADPATSALVATAVGSVETLDLLHALTEADALATGPAAWSGWRAGLVAELVARTRGELAGDPPPPAVELTPGQRSLIAAGELAVDLRDADGGWVVTVVAPDQRGLLAAVAGVLALHRLSVRAASMRTEDGVAVDVWSVEPEFDDPPELDRIREDIRRALDRTLDVPALLARREAARRTPAHSLSLPARVDVVAGASTATTVLEVRAADRLGLLHRLGRALSLAGISVRTARADTLGAEVVDVFYVVDEDGRALTDTRAREIARILRDVAS